MIQPGNPNSADLQPNRFARCVRTAAVAVLAAALGLLAIGPSVAQTPAQAASGSGKRTETPSTRTVKPGPPARARRTASGRASSRLKVMAPSRVILVFPTDTKGGVSDQLSDIISDTIQARISASGRFQSVYFLRSIPTIARALNEATLTANEVSHPFDDDAKLRKLMPNTGFDMALTTSVDSYTYDSAKNQVTLLISARLIDFRGEKPVVRAAAENGSSPANGGNAKELTLASDVAKNITEKLMTSLLAPSPAAPAPSGAAGK